MAEPLGLIGVVGVAVQLIQLSSQLGLDWKDAPAEARTFILELQSLKTVLSETNTNVVLNQDFADAFHGRRSALLSELDPLHETSTQALVSTCQEGLESLLADLRKRVQGHRLGWERLRAAFQASKMREAVEDLRRRCSTLNELLQIDLAAIAASTHREVREGRKEHQNQHQAQSRALGHIRECVDNQEDRQEQEKARQERETVLNWLDPEDHAAEHNDLLRRRQPGTGQWLLESDEFKTWMVADSQMLFCPGIPGAGKTILSATVIGHLHEHFRNDPDIGVAYIYFNFRRHSTQKVDNLVGNLLKQLASTRPALPHSVKILYCKHRRPSLDEISAALRTVATEYSKILVVVDALDECASAEGCRGRFLEQLLELHSTAGASVFTTSRPIPDIVDVFGGFPSLEIRASREDVGRYLQGHMGELMPFVARNKDLQGRIVAAISHAADGMFLLAILFFQSLHDKATPKAVKKALDQLGKQSTAAGEDQKLQVLGRAYDEAMGRINGQLPDLRDLAKRVLSWITCAKRPLRVEELRHALAVEFDEDSEELDEENLHDPGVMVSVCAGLVTADERGIIRLVHYTTQEYFEKTQARWFPDAHLDIARTCAKYLSFQTFASGSSTTAEEWRNRRSSNPLYEYAAKQWGHHAREADTDCDEVMTFLQRDAQVGALEDVLLHYYPSPVRRGARHTIGLHLAAGYGLDRALQRLLSLPGGTIPDIRDREGRTPLIWAADHGHEGAVALLLATAAVDPTACDDENLAPLHYAARGGHEGVVRALLATGAVDVNEWHFGYEGLSTGPPLTLAARGGHEEIVRMLLATGKVDVNGVDAKGCTALRAAAQHGHDGAVRMLLATDEVDINEGHEDRVRVASYRDNVIWYEGGTALFHAAEGGYEAIVQMLLARGDIDVEKRCDGATPLFVATREGHGSIVRMLLATGAVDVNTRDHDGATPLLAAIEIGDKGIVRMLLATGAVDVNARDRDTATPLHNAAGYGHESIAGMLLDTGAVDVNARDDFGHTPITYAARRGRQGMARMLLATGRVDLEAESKPSRLKCGDHADGAESWTPLRYAVQFGHTAVAQLLRDYGAKEPIFDRRWHTTALFIESEEETLQSPVVVLAPKKEP